MKKILFLVFIPFFLFSYRTSYDNTCPDGVDNDTISVGSWVTDFENQKGYYNSNVKNWYSNNWGEIPINESVGSSEWAYYGDDGAITYLILRNGTMTASQSFNSSGGGRDARWTVRQAHVNYECICNLPDKDKDTPPDGWGDWVLFEYNGEVAQSECNIGFSEDLEQAYSDYDGQKFQTTDRYNCCTHIYYYVKRKPPYDCTQKGQSWENETANNVDECQDYIDGENVTTISWEQGDNISPTCCVKWENLDNNGTGDNKGTGDNNGTAENNGTG